MKCIINNENMVYIGVFFFFGNNTLLLHTSKNDGYEFLAY